MKAAHLKLSAGRLADADLSRLIVLGIAVIVAIACIPLLLSYLPYNPRHDLLFHLYRIDGIAQGLRDGQFPVRMQYSQIFGYGYPVSVCYGDLFLYIPALLRLLGFSIKAAYGFFVLIINTFCAWISYVVFKRISGSRLIGLTACALWTLSPYRLLDDVWLRAAVGEYIALSFLPVILYGMYSIIFHEKSNASSFAPVWCAVGIAGVVYSHLISILLFGILLFPIFLILICFKHDKSIFKSILLAILLTLLLSVAFIVPFLDYYSNVDMRINAMTSMAKRQQAADNALQPAQLLTLLQPYQSFSVAGQSLNEMPFGIGLSLMAGTYVMLVVLFLPSFRQVVSRRYRLICIGYLALFVVLSFSTTVYFPWLRDVGLIGNVLIGVVSTIQFPWRLVGSLSFLAVIITVSALSVFRRVFPKIGLSLMLCLMFVSAFEAMAGISSFLTSSTPLNSDYRQADSTLGIANGEYLLQRTNFSELVNSSHETSCSENTSVRSAYRHGSNFKITVQVNEGSGEGSITLPLLDYPYYHATTEDGSQLNIEAGANEAVQIMLPAGYSGAVFVSFLPPIGWKASSCVSGLTVLVLCLVLPFASSSTGPTLRFHNQREKRIYRERG